MSEFFTDQGGKTALPYTVTVESDFEKARERLSGIRFGFDSALSAARRRTSMGAKTLASSEIRKEYAIKASDLNSRFSASSKLDEKTGELSITFTGRRIRLIHYDVGIGKDGRVVARVKKENPKREIPRAFFGNNTGGHRAIMRREGDEAYPIRELYGPAAPQMMNANESLRERMAGKIKETFEKRFDHEVIRVLNGWGAKS